MRSSQIAGPVPHFISSHPISSHLIALLSPSYCRPILRPFRFHIAACIQYVSHLHPSGSVVQDDALLGTIRPRHSALNALTKSPKLLAHSASATFAEGAMASSLFETWL